MVIGVGFTVPPLVIDVEEGVIVDIVRCVVGEFVATIGVVTRALPVVVGGGVCGDGVVVLPAKSIPNGVVVAAGKQKMLNLIIFPSLLV